MSKSVRRVVGAAGVGVAVVLGVAAPASAATPKPVPVPSPTCKIPSLTVAPTSGRAGTRVTVSGQNFSGCPAKGAAVKPTPVLPVEVGIIFKSARAKVGTTVLGTTRTTPGGSFTVSVVLPKGLPGGTAELAVASKDKATGLTYVAVRPFTVVGTSTAPKAPPVAHPAHTPTRTPAAAPRRRPLRHTAPAAPTHRVAPAPAQTPARTAAAAATRHVAPAPAHEAPPRIAPAARPAAAVRVPTSVPAGNAGLAEPHRTPPTDTALLGLLTAAGVGSTVAGARRLRRTSA